MRCIIQRVLNASVTVGGNKISKINKGLLVLVGVHRDDTKADREWLARKILNLRLWPDEQGKPWNKSVKDMGYEVLLVSQFTLYTTLKGNKPDYHLAMAPAEAKEFYATFVEEVRKMYQPDRVFDGEFGAMMEVELNNDGPVTIPLESPSNQQNNGKSPAPSPAPSPKISEKKPEATDQAN